ncbi:hypothetical protein J7E55_01485 [Bacillus sp. ISL-53]|nr:hypothetical protein [Bacillus sp. ISL-53]
MGYGVQVILQEIKKGTGLGLSIAQSLMKKMNGELFATLKNHQFIMTCQWKKRT